MSESAVYDLQRIVEAIRVRVVALETRFSILERKERQKR
jgi:hypothetical protein